ncbi:hypothetical protein TA3x_003398 [Tundrisphaera sp. TA3]|uniref:hypothetical protein n=1 Tax=Tundrisphaera sp. TA3 TaxID=3435775 RepID=UPI003EB75230
MSNPAAPHLPPDSNRSDADAPTPPIPDTDGTGGFGPDVPRLRPEDVARGRDTPSDSSSGSVHVGDDDFVAEDDAAR